MNGKEKQLYELEFKRKFSTCLYKNLRLKLGEMELSQDFSDTERGDKYPLLFSDGEINETCGNGSYSLKSENAGVMRLLGAFSPFAVYEARITELDGECGFAFVYGENKTVLAFSQKNGKYGVVFRDNEKEEFFETGAYEGEIRFSVQTRRENLDVYIERNGYCEYVTTFVSALMLGSSEEAVFMNTSACFYAKGNVCVKGASFFMDSGISQADIRPVKYENGDVIVENGKMFFTLSVRLQAGGYQGVFSWVPGTEEFELTGALFFDAGDGAWCSDVATSLKFDRNSGKWLLWVCSFSHGHVLGRAELKADPRFGKNVIDIKLMDKADGNDRDEEFLGKSGDEDPDLIYDEKTGKWYLAVCRISSENGRYRYHFFESDSPLDGFKFIGKAVCGSETGGSFVRYNDGLYFVCGNGFEERSVYRAYRFGEFDRYELLRCDYPDGGFRGWGSVFTLAAGTRQKTYWLTFDRHKGSDFNWSYGNLYCFEGFDKTEG